MQSAAEFNWELLLGEAAAKKARKSLKTAKWKKTEKTVSRQEN
jgi:hypothetical protein